MASEEINPQPHKYWPSGESLKAKTILTLFLANLIYVVWNKTHIILRDFDIQIDNQIPLLN